jgi:hypothetical protein
LAIFVERSSTIERYHHPPPNLETIVSSFTRVLFLLQLRAIYKCNFKSAHLQVQFTSAIYKLRSTTGQMPALVFTYGSGDHAGNVENNLLGTPNFPNVYVYTLGLKRGTFTSSGHPAPNENNPKSPIPDSLLPKRNIPKIL